MQYVIRERDPTIICHFRFLPPIPISDRLEFWTLAPPARLGTRNIDSTQFRVIAEQFKPLERINSSNLRFAALIGVLMLRLILRSSA